MCYKNKSTRASVSRPSSNGLKVTKQRTEDEECQHQTSKDRMSGRSHHFIRLSLAIGSILVFLVAVATAMVISAPSISDPWRNKSINFWDRWLPVKDLSGSTAIKVEEEAHQFAIVIDSGSTGSRMFVYRFLYPGKGEKRIIECISNKKVLPGLSSLDGYPEKAGEYMRPLFQHAATVVPPPYQKDTLVFIQATAGMRLLSEENQESIYESLYMELRRDKDFPFKLLRKNIGTLSGRLEGFYAALSVNYLTGRMNTHLEPHEPHKEAIVGALDLGGSSTQIVFQHVEDNKMELDESDFWMQSYLAYGVDTIRYRLWSHMTRHVAPDASMTVENPCGFAGYEEWFKGHRLLGTGDAAACGREIRHMLWDEEHEKCTAAEPCGLDGIRHPPLTGKFLAMSVFFFALDCMKQLSPFDMPHWPSPSIDEIEQAAVKFCSQKWTHVNSSSGFHAFTRDELLPYRCVEVVYIHNLLKHGYGFPGDSRNVTFVLDIEGMEVEWTLGYALAEVPLDKEEGKINEAELLDEKEDDDDDEQQQQEGEETKEEEEVLLGERGGGLDNSAALLEEEMLREEQMHTKNHREEREPLRASPTLSIWPQKWEDVLEIQRLFRPAQEESMAFLNRILPVSAASGGGAALQGGAPLLIAGGLCTMLLLGLLLLLSVLSLVFIAYRYPSTTASSHLKDNRLNHRRRYELRSLQSSAAASR